MADSAGDKSRPGATRILLSPTTSTPTAVLVRGQFKIGSLGFLTSFGLGVWAWVHSPSDIGGGIGYSRSAPPSRRVSRKTVFFWIFF